MTEIFYIIISIIGGVSAGIIFFGGLWLTVRSIQEATRPTPRLLVSFMLRVLTAMFLLYGVMSITNHVLYLGIAMISFITVRVIISRYIRSYIHKSRRDLRATES